MHWGLTQGQDVEAFRKKSQMQLPGVYGFEHYYRWSKRHNSKYEHCIRIDKCGLHYLDRDQRDPVCQVGLDQASAPKTSQWPDGWMPTTKTAEAIAGKARWVPSNPDTRRLIIQRQRSMVGLSLCFTPTSVVGDLIPEQ